MNGENGEWFDGSGKFTPVELHEGYRPYFRLATAKEQADNGGAIAIARVWWLIGQHATLVPVHTSEIPDAVLARLFGHVTAAAVTQ